MPGLVVERLFPRYLPRTLAALPGGTLVVSGTNGKTTTTKMVATLLGRRYRVLTNDTGSNFVRGAITAAVDASSWRGTLGADIAVFELDEAHAVRFVDVIAPDHVLLLNVMRDQLDRFGEIDTTAHLLAEVAEAATRSVVLNRDDPRLAALSGRVRGGVSVGWFGVSAALRDQFPTDDELYGTASQRAAAVAESPLATLVDYGPEGATIELAPDRGQAEPSRATIALRAAGAYNAQNAAAAAALARSAGLSAEEVFDGLAAVEPAFGRGETFHIDGRQVGLNLVKNPGGFRHVLRTVAGQRPDRIVIAINDDYADGRDVSWLWDVPFEESLAEAGAPIAPITTSGVRAADMAVRLRYDGVPVEEVQPEVDAAASAAIAAAPAGGQVQVFATYTAMWALQASLRARVIRAARSRSAR
ncbi:MAG: MurT ligase domain-containing protein [Frankiaceae bacterium]|nr:MurT ligase domain-containing protein [Frankiaceae bacterium]